MQTKHKTFIASLLLLVLLGCQAQTAEPVLQAAVIAESNVAEAATAVPTQPPVVYTVAAPEEMPSFSLADPAELTRQAPPTETAAPTLDPGQPSPTPPPTFTPPALPLTSPDEHYWLWRPVPEGGTVWTDKVYPYGSTRGGTLRTHHGVEFYVPAGTAVLAAASGTVRVAGADTAVAYGPHPDFYGNLVVIEHDTALNGQPVFTLYGHLSEIFVAEGQRVESEQIIAYSGATGVADGAHLHFEVRLEENSYASTRNPLLWLYPFPDRGTVAGRVLGRDGRLLRQAPVSLNRVDAPSRYLATTTYADDAVNADAVWQENFAIDDVDAGYYEVVVNAGEKKYKTEVWVYPYRTSFVEIVIGGE